MPSIKAVVTFLNPSDGGRLRPVVASKTYRPHLVVGDTSVRTAPAIATSPAADRYLGVSFPDDGRTLEPGVPHEMELKLVYAPDVDYSELRDGATFTVREGGTIVGHGEVVATPPNTSLERTRER